MLIEPLLWDKHWCRYWKYNDKNIYMVFSLQILQSTGGYRLVNILYTIYCTPNILYTIFSVIKTWWGWNNYDLLPLPHGEISNTVQAARKTVRNKLLPAHWLINCFGLFLYPIVKHFGVHPPILSCIQGWNPHVAFLHWFLLLWCLGLYLLSLPRRRFCKVPWLNMLSLGYSVFSTSHCLEALPYLIN